MVGLSLLSIVGGCGLLIAKGISVASEADDAIDAAATDYLTAVSRRDAARAYELTCPEHREAISLAAYEEQELFAGDALISFTLEPGVSISSENGRVSSEVEYTARLLSKESSAERSGTEQRTLPMLKVGDTWMACPEATPPR